MVYLRLNSSTMMTLMVAKIFKVFLQKKEKEKEKKGFLYKRALVCNILQVFFFIKKSQIKNI